MNKWYMFHECVREARKPPQVITREIPDFPKRILTAAWTIFRGTRVGWTGRRQGKMVGDWGYHGQNLTMHLLPSLKSMYQSRFWMSHCRFLRTQYRTNRTWMWRSLKRKKFQLFQGCQVLHRCWGRPPDWIPNLNQVVCLLFPRIRWNQLLHLQSLQSVYRSLQFGADQSNLRFRLMIALFHLGKILRRGTTPAADPI